MTAEIVNGVFEIMRKTLGIRQADIEKLRFHRHPVLPIFRLWYAESSLRIFQMYKVFLNHCAYALSLLLRQIKDHNRIGIIKCSDQILDKSVSNNAIKRSILKEVGLILTPQNYTSSL